MSGEIVKKVWTLNFVSWFISVWKFMQIKFVLILGEKKEVGSR